MRTSAPGMPLLICCLLLVLLAACGSSDSPPRNSPPEVRIHAPIGDSIFKMGETVHFAGSATDSEDGALPETSLVWTSDVAGRIGTGPTISSVLGAGTHYIFLTATDSEGAEGESRVRISVDAAVTLLHRLPDTHQTTSYTDTFGEDSDYTINPRAYTKLDVAGNPLKHDAAEWVMVRDDVTGLVWEVKRDDDTIHKKGGTYSWKDAQDEFIAQLNNAGFGGYNDWRLPTVIELSTLIHADAYDPAINTAYFPHTRSSGYWSSSVPEFSQGVWVVGFHHGVVYSYQRNNYFNVRAVRGGQ
jgi:hypothetical protein